MTLEELSDHTHNGQMNHALHAVAALFEADGWGPCDSIKAANELLKPAWDAWSTLMERVTKDSARIAALEAEVDKLRVELQEQTQTATTLQATIDKMEAEVERDNEALMYLLRTRLGTRDVHGAFDGVEKLSAKIDRLTGEVQRLEKALAIRGDIISAQDFDRKKIKAEARAEVANLIRQTTPDARSDSNYDRGMFDGRYRAIEQIESEGVD